MTYTAQDFSHLLGTEGFSDDLLEMHFTLYNGYVTNTNKTHDLMTAAEPGTPAFAELRRRFGWEFNGMRLHELYFGNLSKDSGTAADAPTVTEKISEAFGSIENWEKDFRACGAMRGIGWVILAHDAAANRVFNVWVNEHDLGALAGATPLLVMDVFEHAFITEYGLDRVGYMDSFFKAISWSAVESRLA